MEGFIATGYNLKYLYELQDLFCRVMSFIFMNVGLVEYHCCWISLNVILLGMREYKLNKDFIHFTQLFQIHNQLAFI